MSSRLDKTKANMLCVLLFGQSQTFNNFCTYVIKCNRYPYVLGATSTQTEHHLPSVNETQVKNKRPWPLRSDMHLCQIRSIFAQNGPPRSLLREITATAETLQTVLSGWRGKRRSSREGMRECNEKGLSTLSVLLI